MPLYANFTVSLRLSLGANVTVLFSVFFVKIYFVVTRGHWSGPHQMDDPLTHSHWPTLRVCATKQLSHDINPPQTLSAPMWEGMC